MLRVQPRLGQLLLLSNQILKIMQQTAPKEFTQILNGCLPVALKVVQCTKDWVTLSLVAGLALRMQKGYHSPTVTLQPSDYAAYHSITAHIS
ncbi:unnamed protein product [Sphagnum jensenii]|uniref:Uncharacterized protein n=1 Tax=Sphagnum jensenii TaxID=128206 RepID=A0ABP1BSF2_9BRYO